MNCDNYVEQLGDYVDGTLADADRLGLEAHLSACAGCRAVVSDFEAIRSMAASLEPYVPPPHVWQQLSAATARSRRPWSLPSGSLFRWQAAASAAMGLFLATGLWWTGTRLSTITRPELPSTPVFVDASHTVTEQQYTQAIATLEQITSVERAVLDPDTAEVLETGIILIDDAIAESRAALDSNPDSEVAQDTLFQGLHRKVALLQQTLSLINEMRKGNEDGAARIISESNQ
jgi:hypothetical protein